MFSTSQTKVVKEDIQKLIDKISTEFLEAKFIHDYSSVLIEKLANKATTDELANLETTIKKALLARRFSFVEFAFEDFKLSNHSLQQFIDNINAIETVLEYLKSIKPTPPTQETPVNSYETLHLAYEFSIKLRKQCRDVTTKLVKQNKHINVELLYSIMDILEDRFNDDLNDSTKNKIDPAGLKNKYDAISQLIECICETFKLRETYVQYKLKKSTIFHEAKVSAHKENILHDIENHLYEQLKNPLCLLQSKDVVANQHKYMRSSSIIASKNKIGTSHLSLLINQIIDKHPIAEDKSENVNTFKRR